MADADVGDDVYGEDPTVTALEERVADLCGKEAGLFFPSGTQSNLVALLTHCGRGEEVLVGDSYHTFTFEAGGASVFGGLVLSPLATDENGRLTPMQVEAAIKPDRTWFARTSLLALENTVAGQVQPIALTRELCRTARANSLSIHLDGARVWHAATALGVALRELVEPADTVSTCLSKGLGAPAGSVLCGTRDFIREAQRARKTLGGGMRQAGVLAACGLYALENNLGRLSEDHENARALAIGMNELPGLRVHRGDTNMVFIEPEPNRRRALVEFLAKSRILVGPDAPRIRLVLHLDVDSKDVVRVVDAVREFYLDDEGR